MWRFISYRLLQAIPVILAVITVTFFLVRMAPGGPFDSEKAVMPEVKAALEAQYRLDLPIFQQYMAYLGDLAHGELGPSFKYPGRSVNELIAAGLPVTAELGFYALLVALCIGGMAGVIASLKPNTAQDYIPMSAAMIGICIPSFLLGPLLVLVFGIYLDWLPVSGWGDIPGDKILPAITLGAGYAAYIARLSRAGMLEVMSQDYIRTARAKGLPEWQVVTRHALRGGLIPVVAFLGPAFAGLLSVCAGRLQSRLHHDPGHHRVPVHPHCAVQPAVGYSRGLDEPATAGPVRGSLNADYSNYGHYRGGTGLLPVA